jgi:hypothetical protein
MENLHGDLSGSSSFQQMPLIRFVSAATTVFCAHHSSGYSPHSFAKNPGATDEMPMICLATGTATL